MLITFRMSRTDYSILVLLFSCNLCNALIQYFFHAVIFFFLASLPDFAQFGSVEIDILVISFASEKWTLLQPLNLLIRKSPLKRFTASLHSNRMPTTYARKSQHNCGIIVRRVQFGGFWYGCCGLAVNCCNDSLEHHRYHPNDRFVWLKRFNLYSGNESIWCIYRYSICLHALYQYLCAVILIIISIINNSRSAAFFKIKFIGFLCVLYCLASTNCRCEWTTLFRNTIIIIIR